jgi:ribosomal protein S18 acetylase RimI-like enzyme
MDKSEYICRAATPEDLPALARMSGDWENENNCCGYCRNDVEYLLGFRIFVAETGGKVIGYLFGTTETSKDMGAVMPDNSTYFEIEELYIKPAYRSQGVGSTLMKYLEDTLLTENIDKIVLSTAAKDYKRILHFYIDEMGMSFWSARLFKELRKQQLPI